MLPALLFPWLRGTRHLHCRIAAESGRSQLAISLPKSDRSLRFVRVEKYSEILIFAAESPQNWLQVPERDMIRYVMTDWAVQLANEA